MSFQDIIPEPRLLKALEELGHSTPTPIQEQAIPSVLEGNDLLASAQTGTGKTAAFLLPSLMKLAKKSELKGHGPRVLILVPTRELAMQVATEAAKYGKYLPHSKTVCIYGGAPYPPQNRELSKPYEILVATPGRLIDHWERGKINFSRVEMFILDEADRMLDMGFIKPVEKVAAALPRSHQTLLFSATLKGAVLNLAKRLMRNPVEITIEAKQERHDHIEQWIHNADSLDHKHRLLDHCLKDPLMNQVIVFTSTKRQADQLVDTLFTQGHQAAALHGDMNQRQRTRTILQLRQGKIRILVATDVAARGIDVQTISHVINFDLPQTAEDYVHRIGRTGRAGATGVALSFATARDRHMIPQIEKFTGKKISMHSIPGLEAKGGGGFGPNPFARRGNFNNKRSFKPKRFGGGGRRGGFGR